MTYQSVYRNGIWQIEDDGNPGVGVVDVSGDGGDHILEALKTAQVRSSFGYDAAEFFDVSDRQQFTSASTGAYGSTGDPTSNVEAIKEAMYQSWIANSKRGSIVTVSGQLRVNETIRNLVYSEGAYKRVNLTLMSPLDGSQSGFIDRIYDSSSPYASGTAQAGAEKTITLANASSTDNDHYNGLVIVITGGTASGERNLIYDYTGSSRIANVMFPWTTNPDATSTYEIWDATAFRMVGQGHDEGDDQDYGADTRSMWGYIGGVKIGHVIIRDMGFRSEIGPALHIATGVRGQQSFVENVHCRTNGQHGGCQAATSNTITLHQGASTLDAAYAGLEIEITNGNAVGETATISSYDGITKIATISGTWGTIPSAGSLYFIKAKRTAAFLTTAVFKGKFVNISITDSAGIGFAAHNTQSPSFTPVNIIRCGQGDNVTPGALVDCSGCRFDFNVEDNLGWGIDIRKGSNFVEYWTEDNHQDATNDSSILIPQITVSGPSNILRSKNNSGGSPSSTGDYTGPSQRRRNSVRLENTKTLYSTKILSSDDAGFPFGSDLKSLAAHDAMTRDGFAYWSLDRLQPHEPPTAHADYGEHGDGSQYIWLQNGELRVVHPANAYDGNRSIYPFGRCHTFTDYVMTDRDVLLVKVTFSVSDATAIAWFDERESIPAHGYLSDQNWVWDLLWEDTNTLRTRGWINCAGIHTAIARGVWAGGTQENGATNFAFQMTDNRDASSPANEITFHSIEACVSRHSEAISF